MAKSRSHSSVLDRSVLEAALSGLEAKESQLDEQIAHVRALLGVRRGRPRVARTDGVPSIAGPKRRRISAAGRKHIAAAQKKRWAEWKKSQVTQSEQPAASVPKAEVATKKRRISAAGRKRMIEANRKRWAAFRSKKTAEK